MRLRLFLPVVALAASCSASTQSEHITAGDSRNTTTASQSGPEAFLYEDDQETNPAWEIYKAPDPAAAATEFETFETLDEQTAASSSIIRGKIESVESGRVFGDGDPLQMHYATMHVRVGEVLAGDAPVIVDGFVRVEFVLPGLTSEVNSNILEELKALEEGEPTIFFLRHKSEEALQLGYPEDIVQEELGWYRIVSSTGLVTSSMGSADVTLYDSGDHTYFPIVEEIESFTMQDLELTVRDR